MKLNDLIKALESIKTVCGDDAETDAYAVQLQITSTLKYERDFGYSSTRNALTVPSYWVRVSHAPLTGEYPPGRPVESATLSE